MVKLNARVCHFALLMGSGGLGGQQGKLPGTQEIENPSRVMAQAGMIGLGYLVREKTTSREKVTRRNKRKTKRIAQLE